METAGGGMVALVLCILGAMIVALFGIGIYKFTRPAKPTEPEPVKYPEPQQFPGAQPSAPQPPMVPVPQPKKRGLLDRPADWVALAFLVLVAIWIFNSLFGSSSGDPNPVVSNPLVSSSSHIIQYRVSGSTRQASLTYSNSQGGTEQRDVSVPWSVDFKMKNYDFAYLSAQKSQEGGTVTCEILVDGKPWKSSTSNAAYGIAGCSGSVGRE